MAEIIDIPHGPLAGPGEAARVDAFGGWEAATIEVENILRCRATAIIIDPRSTSNQVAKAEAVLVKTYFL